MLSDVKIPKMRARQAVHFFHSVVNVVEFVDARDGALILEKSFRRDGDVFGHRHPRHEFPGEEHASGLEIALREPSPHEKHPPGFYFAFSHQERVARAVSEGSRMNDTTQRASNDSKLTRFTIPFSAETHSAQVLDTKQQADFLGFPTNLGEKDVSFRKILSAVSLGGDDNASPREFLFVLPNAPSPRFTDNNTSETPDVDDDFLHIDKKPKIEK